MPAFARIAVNVPSLTGVLFRQPGSPGDGLAGAFDYEVPEQLAGHVGPGSLVLVPFGNRTVQGIILELISTPGVAETKLVVEAVDPEPVVTAAQIELARWMAERTLASIGTIFSLFLPPGLAQQADTQYSVREGWADGAEKRAGLGRRLLTLLEKRGSLRGRQIDRAMPRLEWRKTAQTLVRQGVLQSASVLPPASVRPKFIRTAQLGAPPEKAEEALPTVGSTEATLRRRQKALRYLISRPEAVNVSWVYAESGCTLSDLQELAEQDLIILREQEVWRDPIQRPDELDPTKAGTRGERHVLTEDQERVWQRIDAGLKQLAEGRRVWPFLLQGVTGSGKTELYLRAARETIQSGKQVIMLVPEVAMTPQTVDRFVAHFPGQVGLMHSRLSDGERYDTWRRARAGALKIVIGPRSALFSPLPRPGLIVADECHDASYHQTEPPFYDAITAAEAYARACGAAFIMGSATPSVVQRYQAEAGGATRLELTERLAAASEVQPTPEITLPPVRIVDMREELKAGNRSIFSREMQSALREVLERGEQAILFLNRRGTATHVFCRNCGYVVRCPRCEAPLTLHATGEGRLQCHRCGYARQMPRKCPECSSTDIRGYGLGTEKVEAEVTREFPKARTLRWDWETTRQKDAHEVILHHFAAGHADVLVGTQMLAKGLDLPRVTLVGIVMADVGLHLPDPFAAERVFQLLTQVEGRAGRSTRGGRVVLQTFAPDHYVIQAAAQHDVNGFFGQELSQRRRLGYPPFTRLLRLEYRHYDAAQAEKAARSAAASLQRHFADRDQREPAIIGPAPCFFTKIDGKYRWQIVLRGSDPASMLEGQRWADWRVEPDPVSLL